MTSNSIHVVVPTPEQTLGLSTVCMTSFGVLSLDLIVLHQAILSCIISALWHVLSPSARISVVLEASSSDSCCLGGPSTNFSSSKQKKVRTQQEKTAFRFAQSGEPVPWEVKHWSRAVGQYTGYPDMLVCGFSLCRTLKNPLFPSFLSWCLLR